MRELRKMLTKFLLGNTKHKLVERKEGNIYKWKDGRMLLECNLENFNVRL
jgi:hypothetical protein